MIFADGAIDIRCGDWREVLADVRRCHAVITDVPYSERVVAGQRSAGQRSAGQPGGGQAPIAAKIRYAGWREEDAREFVSSWFPRVEAWFVAFCSDDIAGWMRSELASLGCEYAWTLPAIHGDDDDDVVALAQTLPWIKHDAAPSFTGTMPAPQAEWIVVARPRGKVVRRHRPGFYEVPQARGEDFVGTKPLNLMRAVVRDYSEPSTTIVDPCCGLGKTARAAVLEGRFCITSEVERATFERTCAEIARGHTPDMFAGEKP